MLKRCFVVYVTLLCLQVAAVAASTNVTITEFLADNPSGLQDEDGAFSDWIEIFNGGTDMVNLDGWFLTDSAANLANWRFPATNLAPNSFLVVFASGKNRAVAGAPLHTSFSLSAAGEYLALVQPDGLTVASEFAPQFPPQFPNVSYGIGQNLQVTKLVSNASPALVLVPTNGNLGATWTAAAFDDSRWTKGTNGIGYETYVPGFAVRNIRANVGVCDLGTADSVLATPALQSAVFKEQAAVINYMNTGGSPHFGNDATFPGLIINVDADNFVLEATGIITIPVSGSWTFGVNSDDGFRVVLGTNTFSYPSPRGPGDTFATFNLTAGDYPVRLVFYECGGGSEVEFFAAAGAYGGFASVFRLVGDTAGGGLAVKSLAGSGSGGNTGIDSLVATDVQTAMFNRNASAYVRLPFTVADPASFSTLTLSVQYNDGFVAWLNGTEVARRNAPNSLAWNSAAPATRPTTNALVAENIGVSAWLNLLQTGTNVLAFQGLNNSSNDSAFLLLAELGEYKVLGITNHYFATPTPGTFNSTDFFAFVEDLKFSPNRGFYSGTNLSVTITSATPGLTIRYTLDGSAPTATSGFVYAGAIPVSTTTTLRAAGFLPGFEPTAPETHTYFFLDQVQAQSTNGHGSYGSAGDYSLNTNITQNPLYRDSFTNDLLSLPTLSICVANEDFFGPAGIWSNPSSGGETSERACSVEYLRPDGSAGFHLNCGLRVQGGVSRTAIPKHSMRLLFKTEYGPGKLAYNLYPDSQVQEFDSITLHAGFNDHWLWVGSPAQLQRDQWCRDTQNALSGYGAHGTYAHLYLNGIYWGLYNMGEQTDASYAAHYLGGDKSEYDALSADQVVDGDANAWTTMFSLADAGVTTDVAYTNLAQYLDIPNFIDYMLMNFYAANTDWPGHNWKAARHRVPGAGFHFFSWDAEWVMLVGSDVNTDRTGLGAGDGSPSRLYAALRAHPEFVRQFGDHAQKYLFNDGALTPAACDARYMTRAQAIDAAIVCETARWGGGYDHQTWLTEQSRLRSQWFPQRTAIFLSQLRNAGLFPQLNAPLFAPWGGLVPPGYALALTNANVSGGIYYTTDGSDPRRWGGAIAPTARLYTTPPPLTNATFLRARVRSGTNWSALAEAMFYVVQDFRPLVVTEIMFNPPRFKSYAGDELEFLELKNTGSNTLDLSALTFTDGINFTFTNGTTLAPGAFFVLARNATAFAAKYPGVTVKGLYTGKLANEGEKLTLAHPLGTNVSSFSYGPTPPWPITPAGYGFSLVRANVAGDPASPASWRPSAQIGGSPGADDPAVDFPPIVLNEVVSRANAPQTDFIELYNPTPAPASIGGWYLTDDSAQPKKFRIPDGTVIAPGDFGVFTEADFNPQPGVFPSFTPNSLGGSLYLFSGDALGNLTGYSHSIKFGAGPSGVSFGRYVVSTGDEFWPAQTALTPGTINGAPRVGPVVINEILYHPELGYDEFVELKNITSTNVNLFDAALPTNTWKLSGLGYALPPNTTLPAQGFLLLVSMDPAAYRAKYSVPSAVQILGPYSGALDNGGETLRLERPDAPRTDATGAPIVPYVVVDEVAYNDKAPWPVTADGDGPSLQRLAPSAYGNEPTNWFASGITTGADNLFDRAPTVTILSPTNGASFSGPASFVITAQAFDPDGTVAKVEFFRDGQKLGELTNSPYYFTVGPLAPGTYLFTVKARDNSLSTATASSTVVVRPPPIGTGTGLNGDYFDNADFTGAKITRIDPTVNFDWGGGSPDPAIGADTFSARWTGQVQPRLTERYTFYTTSDDGVRLWVNNQLLIDNWTDHGPTEDSGGLDLVAGNRYDIRMDFYENGGGAVAKLAWAAADLTKEIIPTSQSYSRRAPVIVTQPQNALGRAGTNLTLRVVADGASPLFYQWFYNGQALAGATGTNLTVTNLQTTNAGSYWVVVTNSEASVASQVATITLVQPPVFLQQPQSQTLLVGDTLRLSVVVTGTPPFGFNWRSGATTLVPWGQGAATFTLTNAQLSNSGIYSVVVTNLASPAPGVTSAPVSVTVLLDTDGDRMPNVWEIAHGLNPTVNDANLDSDHDGMTNLQEYIAGTDPQDPLSYLKVDSILTTNTVQTLQFLAISNRFYRVLYRTSLDDGLWETLADVPAQPVTHLQTITDPAGRTNRFYRLVIPQQP